MTDDFYHHFGKKLKRLRKEKGLSQNKIGKILGVSYQQIQKYENGTNRLPVDKLATLKAYYGISCDAFLPGCVRNDDGL